EGLEAGGDFVGLEAHGAAGGVDAECVLDVVAAGGRERDADFRRALVVDLEGGAGGAQIDPAGVPVGVNLVAGAVGLDLALGVGREALPVGKAAAGGDV